MAETPKIAPTKRKICTKCTKNAVKTAKKPVFTEKMAATVQKSGQKDPRGGIQNFKGHEKDGQFNSKTAKVASELAIDAKRRRKQALEGLAQDLDEAGWRERIVKAMKKGDWAEVNGLMALGRFVGYDFASSPDAKHQLELSGQVDTSLEITITEA